MERPSTLQSLLGQPKPKPTPHSSAVLRRASNTSLLLYFGSSISLEQVCAMGSNVSSPLHIVILNGSESCTHARTHTERERERGGGGGRERWKSGSGSVTVHRLCVRRHWSGEAAKPYQLLHFLAGRHTRRTRRKFVDGAALLQSHRRDDLPEPRLHLLTEVGRVKARVLLPPEKERGGGGGSGWC